MRISEHLEGYQRSKAVAQALDPRLPRLKRNGAANLWGFRDNAFELLRSASEVGDVVRLDLLYKPTVFVQHPEAVAEIFEQPDVWWRGEGLVPLIGRNVLTTNGERWRVLRDLIQPSFHPQMAGQSAQTFARDAATALDRWEELTRSGDSIDIAWHTVRLFARWATRAFGFDPSDAEADRFPDALLRLQRWGFRTVAGGATRSAQIARDLALLEGVVARGLDTPAPPQGAPSYLERLRQDHSVDRAELRDHLLLPLVASADNPPNVAAFALWHLAHNPAVQQTAREEVIRELGGDIPSSDSLERVPILDRVVSETMRLLPAVWFLARIAQRDTTLRGYRMPAGTMAFPSPYFLHRHSSVWRRPEEFIPDRFLPAEVEARPRFAYLPFGAGPRICVGARLATLEVRAFLALFLQRYRALPSGEKMLPLEGTFALRARGGIPLRLAQLEG